ncbi:substrate-binding domain-containing protein [Tepidiforma flava]|uniref:Substrate-binding domain-containing protein n=1 Tax=Tepidiforma flava TaxID=3004094 RepID=A0ABY7MA94_9CHLR|nr:substrate-binding domain-containing protein [Tepidiforma flava]WBL37478.1 substrate-binding domain-containing protein [Tepidiforma flava]
MVRRGAWLVLVVLGALAAAACGGGAAAGPADRPGEIGGSLILATTTSTQDSGLLDVLVPRFEAETGTRVKVIAVGSGAALEMAKRGDADAVLSHAPEAEAPLVASGDLVEGRRVMHNDFVLVGPPSDPAGVRGAGSIEDAMRRIAAAGTFVSRGDNSGTHAKELALWRAAGLDPAAVRREETGQGMGATLNIADQRRAYTLTDRATYLALRSRLELTVLFAGDAALQNVYHVYVVNPEKHPGVKAAQARAWAAFLVSDEAQQVIAAFGRDRYGEPLFFADAAAGAAEGSR